MPLRFNPESTVEDVVRRLKAAVQQVVTAFSDDAELVRDVLKLQEYGIEMAKYAPEYDFKNIQANGYRALIEMGIRLMKYSVNIIVTRGMREHYQDFKDIVHTYVNVIPYLQRMRDESKNSKSVDIYGDLLIDYFVDYLHAPRERGYATTLMGCYDFGYYSATMIMKYLALIAIVESRSLKEFIMCLFSARERKKIVDRTFSSVSVSGIRFFVAHRITFFQRVWSPFTVNWFGCRKRKEFMIERQDDLKIHVDLQNSDVTVIKRKGIPTKLIKCRLLHEPVPDVLPTTLMINVHGGGYCVGTIYNNEVYLRKWAIQNAGKLVTLSVDISLAPEHKFPAQIQEIVDVFLFLTKSPDDVVISKIGFVPKKIILSGDSSGGCLVVAATVALNEMRKKWPEEMPRMPDAIFSFYGSFSVDIMMIPSYMICATTVFLSGINFATFVDAYVPAADLNQNFIRQRTRGEEQGSNILLSVGRSLLNFTKWIFSINSDEGYGEQIILDEESKRKMKSDIIDKSKLVKSAHISPINYDDFESMSDIQLFLYAGLTDPVTDHSVALANKWKGKVEMEVCGCMHGYLNMIGLDVNALASCDRISKRIGRFIDE